MMYFCDDWNRKVYEVVVLPKEQHEPNLKRRVHDVDVNPLNWYYVAEDRLQPTKKLAIWAAKDALDQREREISEQLARLHSERAEIEDLRATAEGARLNGIP